MKWKDGVYTEVLVWDGGKQVRLTFSPEIKHAQKVADNLCRTVCGAEATCTAGFDGKHKYGSKHYDGNAFDLRIKYFTPEQRNDLFQLLKTTLGADYDVVLHSTHIHIEYDPK